MKKLTVEQLEDLAAKHETAFFQELANLTGAATGDYDGTDISKEQH